MTDFSNAFYSFCINAKLSLGDILTLATISIGGISWVMGGIFKDAQEKKGLILTFSMLSRCIALVGGALLVIWAVGVFSGLDIFRENSWTGSFFEGATLFMSAALVLWVIQIYVLLHGNDQK